MNPIALLPLALAPGVFWLWFFLRRRVYRPKPRRLLALTFFLGMLSTIPAGLLEGVTLRGRDLSQETSLATVAAGMLFVVGPVEELAKFAVVRLVPYRSLYFDEPLDGLIYSAAASLGFASLENLGYMLAYGPAVILVRGPLSTLAHVMFGSIWGYALAWQSQRDTKRITPILIGVAVAAVVHGLFNVAVFSSPLFALVLTLAGFAWVLTRFQWGQRISPFRLRRNYPLTQCETCGRQIRVISRYCRFCGAPARPGHSTLSCGLCGALNRAEAAYCTRCGDRFLF